METESRRRTSTRYTVSRGVTTRCMYKFELKVGWSGNYTLWKCLSNLPFSNGWSKEQPLYIFEDKRRQIMLL